MTNINNLGLIRLDTEALQFTGPKTNHCFGVPYITFSLGGIKAEGGDLEWEESAEKAHNRFFKELNAYCADAKQIAWRLYPEMQWTPDGMYTMRCRLAVWS